MTLVLLDAGPLGLLTHPKATPENLAADLWAQTRQQGQPTAGDKALDGDVILAAQALMMDTRGRHPVIATTNVKHLALFVDAQRWQDITV